MFLDSNDKEHTTLYMSSKGVTDRDGNDVIFKVEYVDDELKLIDDGGLKYDDSDWGYIEYNINGSMYDIEFFGDESLTIKLELI